MLKSNPLQVEKRPSIDRGFTGLECDFHECPFYCVAELTGAQTLDVCLGRRLFSHETAIKRWPIVRRITSLLSRVHQGDSEALNTLIPLIYEELKRLAASHLRRENANATIQTAAPSTRSFPLTRMLAPGAMGESDQVATGKTVEGQAQNRRVVVRVLQNKAIAGVQAQTATSAPPQ